MKVGNILVLGVIGLGGYAVFKSLKKIENLEYGISSIKLDSKKTNLSDTVLNCIISVYNPNSQDVKFTSFTGNIFSNDKRIGNIDSSQVNGKLLKSRQKTDVPVSFQLPNGNILESVVNTFLLPLLGGKKATVPEKITVKGTLKAEGLPALPVNENINFKTA